MKVKIRNLTKKFKDITAVDDLSADIDDGELVTFLGPSGCGKSTTLFMIAGLHAQDSGSIFFDEKLVNDIDTEKRNIGMVFQNYALYPHMTVLKNIMFPLNMLKVSKKEALSRVEEVTELLKIKELLDRKPSQLSGGQQQRVAIARALVKKPNVLLMDEPLSNLDAKLRIETREEIRKLQKKLNITTIFVTHDQDEAASISDKILLMNKGKLQQYDTPRNIYNCPSNLFTAKFIGNAPINTFNLNNIDGQFYLDKTKTRLHIDMSGNQYNNYTDKCTIAIRPEDFIICSEEESDIKGIVEHVEMIGKDNLIVFRIEDYKFRCFTSSDYRISPEDNIFLRIRREKLHIFDVKSNANIKLL